MVSQSYAVVDLHADHIIVVNPDGEERRMAMFKDNKLRLLMSLVGMERVGIDDEPNATWIIPSALSSQDLQEVLKVIEKHRSDPVLQYGDENDPVAAKDMLRRKPSIKPRAAYDDDSDGDGIDSDVDEDFSFPAGGPTNRKSDALEKIKQRRKKHRAEGTDDEADLDEHALKALRRARLLADLEKRRKIKSSDLVHDSDDETDEEKDREFFAREEQRRARNAGKLQEALKVDSLEKPGLAAAPTSRKRKIHVNIVPVSKKRKLSLSSNRSVSGNDDPVGDSESDCSLSLQARETSEMSEDGRSDTSFSSPLPASPDKALESFSRNREPIPATMASKVSAIALEDDRDDEIEPLVPAIRRRARAVLYDESESE